MGRPRVSAGGGPAALFYLLRKSREAGGIVRLYRRMRTRNACKTCALGMGGQAGGMRNEAGRFPEVCKKSIQAQAADMRGAVTEELLRSRSLEDLGRLGSAECERLGRLAFPILAEEGETHYRRVSWDEAMARAGDSFAAAPPDETFFYASGRSSNEAAFLLQLVARAYGTVNIHNCSSYCHAASGAALSRIYGSGTASVVLDDLEKTDLALVAGANPASNHPRMITSLVKLRRRGGRVIVVNPMRELGLERFRIPSDWRSFLFGSDVNDLYLQPKTGTDIFLFRAMLKGLIERRALDGDFIERHTSGWEAVRRDAEAASWDDLSARCGVARRDIERAVAMLAGARNGILLWAMGLTHHAHGVDNIFALANVALARGWLGRPGAGLLPIRGHSNVQGVGSVGVTPRLSGAFAKKLGERLDIPVREEAGQDTMASMRAADDGRIRAALLLGGNLLSSNPDTEWAARALRNIPFTFSLTTKLNPGHFAGRGKTSLVVPVFARDEEPEKTTQESMFNFVRLSDGGRPSVEGEIRSETAVISGLAGRIVPGKGGAARLPKTAAEIRAAIAGTVAGYERIGAIEKEGEFQIGGRTFHEPRFNTKDGRARFHLPGPADDEPPEGAFRLMTIRSEGQFNSVVYEEEDLYRGTTRRDVVMMSAADAERIGCREGERLSVVTDAGRMEAAVFVAPLPAGCLAMYYPEANRLVPRRIDEQSGTPAFKSVIARLERWEESLR